MTLALALALGACRSGQIHDPALRPEWFPRPADHTHERLVGFRRVVTLDGAVPVEAQVPRTLCYLEKYRGRLFGSREDHEFTIILDAAQRRVGMIGSDGQFMRFDEHGHAVAVIRDDLERGLRAFFGVPVGRRLLVQDRAEYNPYIDDAGPRRPKPPLDPGPKSPDPAP
jgi:hypothetical protein